MSLPPSRAARAPRLSGSLCALLLLLLLLTPPGPLASAGPVAVIVRELRCVCLTTTPGIHPKMIAKMQVIGAGPQCPKVEVIHPEEQEGSLSGPRNPCDEESHPENLRQVGKRLIKRKDYALEKIAQFLGRAVFCVSQDPVKTKARAGFLQ
ncbi:growth-regulated alpha protein-like [Prionailurus iriomotensis]